MTNEHQFYENPLVTRYASREMSRLFGEVTRIITWRKLWVALAETEMELGLPITHEQLEEMRENVENLNLDEAHELEEQVRHDVMAHIRAFGLKCPGAKGIIHLGATSCFITDNTDLILLKEGMIILKSKIESLLGILRDFALKYKSLPTLGFTHYQPAQFTTVGKRACLWLQDVLLDYHDLTSLIEWLPFRGVKGVTGTQASFLKLFDGNGEKVKKLDEGVTRKMGFNRSFLITGQTYSRKVDSKIASCLSGIAQSAHRFSNDIRLLMNLQEIEEPFGKSQVGSSAMPYKRNPMRTERMAALSRFLITLELNTAFTQSGQWFERTLDDSANRRLVLPQMFLAADSILQIYLNVASGLQVYEKIIGRRVMENLPFIASENILMEAVNKGGDRQKLHEKIRAYAMETTIEMREKGEPNRLLERLTNDSEFPLSKEEIDELSRPELYIGRSVEQVEEFIEEEVNPVLSGVESTEKSWDLRV